MVIDDLVPSEHDFTGTLENWEDRVFLNADHFRLHRFYGRGGHDHAEVKDFRQAMQMAADALKTPEHRVLVYAITDTGRFICLTQQRWNHYAELWLRQKRKELLQGVKDLTASENWPFDK